MAATKVNANWSGVAHGSNTITRVTQVSFDYGGSLATFNADTDHYPTLIVNLMNNPSASVTTADVGLAMDSSKFASGAGSAGGTTLSATLKDTRGATGGDVIFAMSNAVVENTQSSGQHAQFASATINFKAFSSDGSTPPMSISRA